MRAFQLTGAGNGQLIDCDVPIPGAGQVLIKVLACGVCGSDLNSWRGIPGIEFPMTPGAPGHEVWGEIAALGPEADGALRTGQRITGLMFNGYAQYTLARADEVQVLSDEFAPERPVLGEPLACAANIVRRIAYQPGDRVAIVGFGYIASLVMRFLFPERLGHWVAISRRPESRERALECGAAAAYAFESVPADLWDSFPIVIEAAGVQRSLDYATWLTAYGGRLVIAGYHADGPRTVNMQSWNWKGIDVVNAHERKPETYMRGLKDALSLIRRHPLDASEPMSHSWSLDHVSEALRTADQPPSDYVKGVIWPWRD